MGKEVREVRSTRSSDTRCFGAVIILFVNIVSVKDKPSVNAGHFSYLRVDVCSNLYGFEFDGRVENLENAEFSGSRIGN